MNIYSSPMALFLFNASSGECSSFIGGEMNPNVTRLDPISIKSAYTLQGIESEILF